MVKTVGFRASFFMKGKEEFDLIKRCLNEIVRSNNNDLYARSVREIVNDLIEIQKKDSFFIKTMFLLSRFYDAEGRLIENMTVIDFLTEDVRAIQMIPYMELVEKMKEKKF